MELGKSTLAKVIAGEAIVTRGKVIIDNQDCANIRDFNRARFISRVFQDPAKGTARNLTILENLIFANRCDLKRKPLLTLKKRF
ncbi:MAG: ATP-binding cassette domain-containing protein [Candidatus Midichloria sp.]|nr:MAG: ATP-binding cassette domain-containing protein [Candidatus Midichloria sp.]